MKKTKRNVAIIVVLLFVCAAVYFNWSYNAQWGSACLLYTSPSPRDTR